MLNADQLIKKTVLHYMMGRIPLRMASYFMIKSKKIGSSHEVPRAEILS